MRMLVQRIKLQFHAIVHAFQFLSILPMPNIPYSEEAAKRSLVFYPFVGFCIGIILILSAVILPFLFPPLVCGILLLIIWTVLSGALHLDGLMDTADGLLSHRPPERMLEIMKDSRVGSWAVLVCVLYMLLKGTLLIGLLEMTSSDKTLQLNVFTGLASAPVLSRWFMVCAVSRWPYARKEGFGSPYERGGWSSVIFAGIIALICLAVLSFVFGLESWFYFLPAIMIVILAGVSAAHRVHRKLGGLTGDIYGALNELLELLLLLLLVMMIHTIPTF